jgi:type IV pilus assembly protein PilO
MNEFFDKLAKMPHWQKGLVVVLMGGVICLVYYQLYYSELEEQKTRLETEYKNLEKERIEYENRKKEYLAFRQEVQKLTEEQKELLKVLPKTAEIPSFLEGLHTQATLAGLDIIAFTRMDEQPQDIYVRIPVFMEVKGNYHQIVKFAHSVGQLKRIVNIENVELQGPHDKDGVIHLTAKFNAATYRFKEKGRR